MRKLTILVSCINAVGHMNACAGALSSLLTRGHRVIFVLEKAFEGKLSSLGYEEVIFSHSPPQVPASDDQQNGDDHLDENKSPLENEKETTENPGEREAQFMLECKIIGPFTPLEKMENMEKVYENPAQREECKRFDDVVKKAIENYKPDLIYVDGSLLPCVYYSDIPWIHQISTSPLFLIIDEDLPPGGSGLPTHDSSEWHLFDKARKQFLYNKYFSEIVEELGYERFPNDEMIPETQVLTVHAYPEELNYDAVRSKGWFNLEVFNKTLSSERVKLIQLVDEAFLNNDLDGKFSGKLIYVSMGSMGSIDLDLMRRLLDTLSKTNHKYIVSKGPRHAELDLPSNAWGDRYLPQTKIVPHVDLVITHGGNNTVTETFAEGKPMIVFPLFADQFDNAQRFHETGLGAKIEPYNFTEEQLIETIDRLLADAELVDKLRTASKRIHQSDKHQELAVKIEQLIGA